VNNKPTTVDKLWRVDEASFCSAQWLNIRASKR